MLKSHQIWKRTYCTTNYLHACVFRTLQYQHDDRRGGQVHHVFPYHANLQSILVDKIAEKNWLAVALLQRIARDPDRYTEEQVSRVFPVFVGFVVVVVVVVF